LALQAHWYSPLRWLWPRAMVENPVPPRRTTRRLQP